MAGAGWRAFTVGQLLTSAQVQTYMQDQAVQVHASAAARSSALGTAVSAGMVSYRSDEKALELYTGSAWQPVMQGRNAIINGGFDIWQRGAGSFSGQGTFNADRFYAGVDGGTYTVTRQTFTPGAAPVAGYESEFFLRMNFNSGGTSAAQYLVQRVEDVRTFAGQVVTLSYWAKADSAVTSTPLAIQGFGSGGSSPVVTGMSSASITTSWTRFTHTFTLPSISGKTVGAGSLIELQLARHSAQRTVDFWGVQLEAGSVATPFTRAGGTLQGELAACQRYFQRFGGIAYEPLGSGFVISSTTHSGIITHKVTMRTSPTVTLNSVNGLALYISGGVVITSSNMSTDRVSPDKTMVITSVASGLTAGQSAQLLINSSGTGFLDLSAEL